MRVIRVLGYRNPDAASPRPHVSYCRNADFPDACRPEAGTIVWKCPERHMSYSLNSLKGGIYGIIQGTTIGVNKGDTRSLDNGSYGTHMEVSNFWLVFLRGLGFGITPYRKRPGI